MKLSIKRLTLGFAAFAIAISTALSITQPANATGPCGPSYSLRGSHPMMAGNSRGGTLQIYWSNTKKNNCAVALCSNSADTCGLGVHGEVHIRRTGDSSWNDNDSGWNFTAYAGPVYSYTSAGRCIDAYARFYVGAGANVGSAYITNKYCG